MLVDNEDDLKSRWRAEFFRYLGPPGDHKDDPLEPHERCVEAVLGIAEMHRISADLPHETVLGWKNEALSDSRRQDIVCVIRCGYPTKAGPPCKIIVRAKGPCWGHRHPQR